jgi:hypothetical protein
VTQPGRHRIRVFVLEHGVRFAVRARIFLTMIAIIDGAGKHVGNYPIIFDGCLRIISYLYYWLLDVTVLLPWIDCLLPSYHAVFLAKALIPMVIFVLLMAVSVSFKFFRVLCHHLPRSGFHSPDHRVPCRVRHHLRDVRLRSSRRRQPFPEG